MKKNDIKKYFIIICLASLLTPFVSNAQLGAGKVPVADSQVQEAIVSKSDLGGSGVGSAIGSVIGSIGSLLGLGDLSGVINSISKEVNSALSKVRQVYAGVETLKCVSSLTNAQSAQYLLGLNNIKNPSYWSQQVGPNIISSPITVTQNISNALNALNSMQSCIEAQVTALRTISPATVVSSQKMQAMLDDYTKIKNTIDARRDELSKQLQGAQAGYWKNQTVQELSKLSKTSTKNLFNTVTNDYKIKDYNQYQSNLADKVYTRNAIAASAPSNATDQLIMQNYLANPNASNKVPAAVYAKTDAYIGQRPDEVDIYSGTFYTDMSKFFMTPYFMDTVMRNSANTAQAQGVQAASQEISQSSGYKAPRNCSSSDPMQPLQQQYQKLNDKFAYQLGQLNQLEQDRDMGVPYDPNDLALAATDYDKALSDLEAFNRQYPNGIQPQCDRVVAPAETVKTVAAAAANNYANDLSIWNDNDLLGYSSRIASTTNVLFTNMIFGGDVPNAGSLNLSAKVLGASITNTPSQPVNNIRGPVGIHPRGE